MKRPGLIISRYLLQNILPYFGFTWMLLSVILFVQQASRYADIFFSVNIPKTLVWQLTFALIPNVVAFTAPMAVLIGVIIGLTKMQGDSELTAIRAAGAGNLQIAMPVIVLGIVLSLLAFIINWRGVPMAAAAVRAIALQTALHKLESPIEPGAFNTEIGGYTIYVREGDNSAGTWKDLFIYYEDAATNQARLITAKSGRIDSTIASNGELAELVLENAVANTVPLSPGSGNQSGKTASENLGEIRLAIKTKRGEIVKKLTKGDEAPEELGLEDLAKLVRSADGKEKLEAQIQWQRRLLLSVTPFIFALLGTVLVLRFNRGGRGFGIALALGGLISYYLVTLGGEQLARTGKTSVLMAALLPIGASAIVIGWLAWTSRGFRRPIFRWSTGYEAARTRAVVKKSKVGFYQRFTGGIRDLDIVLNLLKYYGITLAFLTAIYLIFTAFEMWKFAGTAPSGIELLVKYLFYLIPLVYLQLAPSAAMIATLATFVIKSRQNEVVTWTAAGQSVYRLLMPCFVLTAAIGFVNWTIQEFMAPKTNQKQDTIRTQIRNKGILARHEGKYWVSNGNRIYSFDRALKISGSNREVGNLTVFEFNGADQRLMMLHRAPEARWDKNRIVLAPAIVTDFSTSVPVVVNKEREELNEAENPFNNLNQKPSYLTAAETRSQLGEAESLTEQRNLGVALQKKYSTPFLPLIIALFTAPFALSLSRKGKVITVGYAVALWLVFTGIASGFEQAGLSGSISATLAVWTPLVIFAMLGTFLFSRVRT